MLVSWLIIVGSLLFALTYCVSFQQFLFPLLQLEFLDFWVYLCHYGPGFLGLVLLVAVARSHPFDLNVTPPETF